jgi:hypothetical protein
MALKVAPRSPQLAFFAFRKALGFANRFASAFVNMAAIRVALNANNVFQAICSGYMEGMLPPSCAICSRCPDVVGCVTSGVCGQAGGMPPNAKSKGVSTCFFMVSLLMVAGAFFGIGRVWQYKRTRDDMCEPLAKYMSLEDNDSMGAS